ncbi:MAG: hypothetical protein DRP06_04505 [Candidatus Aenigmatarchaeota archaeon]|nr:MAG: hypothetical protein DRP06_04505 [Candidatus Aenigmarchaeota archaeon]
MSYEYKLKPNRASYVDYSFFKISLGLFLIFVIIYSIASLVLKEYVLFVVIFFIAIELFNYYSLNVQYRKESYTFFKDKIIYNSGGIFSNSETELIIKNITHVTMKLPYLENKLLKTGNVVIESAGSGVSEIFLKSIDNTNKMYEYIEKIMQYNGFKLSKSKLVQKERPSSIGVFFEVFRNLVTTLIIMAWFFFDTELSIIRFVLENQLFLYLSGFLALLVFGFLAFRFLDLKKRVYSIYSDTITYSEGFLSKNYSFIPIENLSDSTITQTIIDKIFGLYDVKISCQGTKQEVLFKNMANGKEMESNIDKLISETNSLVGTGKQQISKTNKQTAKSSKSKTQITHTSKTLPRDTNFTAEYKMDTKRTMLPLLIILPICLILFPLMILWIIISIQIAIKINSTKYFVKSNSIEERYNFISSKNKEFTNDKIMSVIFKESFIDKWFNTCSIHFWSIGSSEDIKFENIKKSDGIYQALLAKSGIGAQEEIYKMDSNFKIIDFLKANLFITLIFTIILLGSSYFAFAINMLIAIVPVVMVVLCIFIIIYKIIYYKKSNFTYFKDYVYFTRGIFFKDFYYVLYDNIKDLTTLKYPFSGFGSIKFNVAGEHLVQEGKSQMIISNNFKINYIADINNKDELIDLIFYKRPDSKQLSEMNKNISSYSPETIRISKPDLANSLVGWILIGGILGLIVYQFAQVILAPFILLLIILLGFVIWSVKAKSFSIQNYRVVANSGILYKKQTSIIFSKIDHINFSQGVFNKIYNNGNITVNTTGSSSAELVIRDIPDYKEFYGTLKGYY